MLCAAFFPKVVTNRASLVCFLDTFREKKTSHRCYLSYLSHIVNIFNHKWNLYIHEFSISGIILVTSIFWIISSVYSRNLSNALFMTMTSSHQCQLREIMEWTCFVLISAPNFDERWNFTELSWRLWCNF